jgi:DNA-directed RNA polymerase specialized sigma24 family protein
MGVLVGDDSDLTLLQRYRAGDSAAFRQLVVRYERPIYNAAFWVLRSAEDARDVAQIVFMRVAERADEYDPRYKFFSWIYRIAVNAKNHSTKASTTLTATTPIRSGSCTKRSGRASCGRR